MRNIKYIEKRINEIPPERLNNKLRETIDSAKEEFRLKFEIEDKYPLSVSTIKGSDYLSVFVTKNNYDILFKTSEDKNENFLLQKSIEKNNQQMNKKSRTNPCRIC